MRWLGPLETNEPKPRDLRHLRQFAQHVQLYTLQAGEGSVEQACIKQDIHDRGVSTRQGLSHNSIRPPCHGAVQHDLIAGLAGRSVLYAPREPCPPPGPYDPGHTITATKPVWVIALYVACLWNADRPLAAATASNQPLPNRESGSM